MVSLLGTCKGINDALNTYRFTTCRFQLLNNTTQPYSNLAQYFVGNPNRIGGTTFTELRTGAGDLITDPNVARDMVPSTPTDPVLDGNGQVKFLYGASGFQVLTPAEAKQLTQEAFSIGALSDPASWVLEYGAIVRAQDGSRTLPPGGTGDMTIAWRRPWLGDKTIRTYFYTMILAVDPTGRITRAPGETTASAVARAQAAGATQLGLVGTDSDVAPAPLQTVRNPDPMYYVPDPVDLSSGVSVPSPIGSIGGPVVFDASGVNGDGLTYAWDFGDGSNSTAAYATHTYTARGTYAAKLTITDKAGRVTTKNTPVAVLPEMREMMLQQSSSSSFTTHFDAGPPVDGLTYAWTFGDGTTASVSQLDHTFPKIGTYNVELNITDTRTGGLASSSLNRSTQGTLSAQSGTAPPTVFNGKTFVTLWRNAPTAKFSTTSNGRLDAPVGKFPLTVAFDASASEDVNVPVQALTYTWDFGDGSTGTGKQPTHVYPQMGLYLAVLTVKNEAGLSDTYRTFVQTRDPLSNTTFRFTYPTLVTASLGGDLSAQALDQLEREDLLKQSQFSTANSPVLSSLAGPPLVNLTFPYVVHNSAAAPRGSFFPMNSLGQRVPSTYCESLKLYVNGIIKADGAQQPLPLEIIGDDFPPADGSLRQCSSITFYPVTIAKLPARVFNDVLISTQSYLSNTRIYTFGGLRVPLLYTVILPDEFMPGEEAGPRIREYTNPNLITGKTDYLMTVHIRQSEAKNGIVKFKVPVLAVDDTGKFLTQASGKFNARFLNMGAGATSDCGECLMVNGRASITVSLPYAGFGTDKPALFTGSIELQSGNKDCRNDASLLGVAAQASLNGCSTVAATTEFPIANAPTTLPYKFPEMLLEVAKVGLGKGGYVYGDQAKALLEFRDYMNFGFYEDMKEFALDSIPVYGNIRVCNRLVKYYVEGGAANGSNLTGTVFACGGTAALAGTLARGVGTFAKNGLKVLQGSAVAGGVLKTAMGEAVTQRLLANLEGPQFFTELQGKFGDVVKTLGLCGQRCIKIGEAFVSAYKKAGKTVDEGVEALKSASGACPTNSFSADTVIWTSNGLTPIGQLLASDGTGYSGAQTPAQVWSYNEDSGKLELSAITHVFSGQDAYVTVLTLQAPGSKVQEQIITTPEHPFFVQEGRGSNAFHSSYYASLSQNWIGASYLKVGNHVRTANGKFGVVTSVITSQESRRMFNLEVVNSHTFFVGAANWLVHNASRKFNACDGAYGNVGSASTRADALAEASNIILRSVLPPGNLRKVTVAAGVGPDGQFVYGIAGPAMKDAISYLKANQPQYNVLEVPDLPYNTNGLQNSFYHAEQQVFRAGATSIGISRIDGLCSSCEQFFRDFPTIDFAVYVSN